MSLILEALKKSERQRQVGTVPTLATPEQLRAALVREPGLVVLADDSVSFDPALFAEEGNVPYGKRRYRYWSGITAR